jgi:hypothetical protein
MPMTEADWLACSDPTPMLDFLRGKASDRKLRLLACANCRLLWRWITDERSQQTVVLAERLSEGLASEAERLAAFSASFHAATVVEYDDPEDEIIFLRSMAASYAHNAVWDEAIVAAQANSPSILPELTGLPVMLPLCLFRDIFGNSFRPSPPLLSAVTAWNDRTIPRIAQGIYDERQLPEGTLDTGRLAILADALLDAGCDDEELIAHCRSAGPHVRGCWAVDLMLGKS